MLPGRRLRVVAASLVALSLLAPGSLGARTGCGVCPTDCPMHRVVDEPETHDMPCHRASVAAGEAPDAPVVRAACGRTERGDLTVEVRDRSAQRHVIIARSASAPEPWPVRLPVAPDRDVPTAPPRDGRSS